MEFAQERTDYRCLLQIRLRQISGPPSRSWSSLLLGEHIPLGFLWDAVSSCRCYGGIAYCRTKSPIVKAGALPVSAIGMSGFLSFLSVWTGQFAVGGRRKSSLAKFKLEESRPEDAASSMTIRMNGQPVRRHPSTLESRLPCPAWKAFFTTSMAGERILSLPT